MDVSANKDPGGGGRHLIGSDGGYLTGGGGYLTGGGGFGGGYLTGGGDGPIGGDVG